MTVRLLTLLALALPLAACAAPPATGRDAAGAAPAAAVASTVASTVAPAATGAPAVAPAVAPSIAPTAAPAPASAAAPSVVAQPAPAAHVPAHPPATAAMAPAQPVAAASTPPAAPLASATTPAAGAPSGVTAPNPTVPGTVTPATVTMPSGSATGSLLQTLLALLLVLAVLGGLAWFLKRYGPKGGGVNANVRVVGSLNLGGRERVLVVEVGSQWIVLGASPGRINALATMPRQEGADGAAVLAPHAPGAHSFADWLKQTIDKRK